MGGFSNCHARSKSLPTRPHPLVSECDEHLCRLKALDSASWTPLSMTQKLSELQDLHECVNKLLLLRRTREAFSAHRREKWVDEVFDGSLRLLDMCSAAKDGVIHTKECVRELQSMVRRRWGSGVAVANEVDKYLVSRKVVKRAIQKALWALKTNKLILTPNKDVETMSLIGLLFEAEAATSGVLESILCYVSGKKGKWKGKGWALVSKLMRSKKAASEETEGESNEYAAVDAAMDVVASKYESGMSIENVTDQLGKLDMCGQDLERGLEGVFRRLIRNRVSLLNILSS